jgi:hypothetical protein
MGPLAAGAAGLFGDLLGRPASPGSPSSGGGFGRPGPSLREGLSGRVVPREKAKALGRRAGGPRGAPAGAVARGAVALMLGLAGHHVGWPFPKEEHARSAPPRVIRPLAPAGDRNRPHREVD